MGERQTPEGCERDDAQAHPVGALAGMLGADANVLELARARLITDEQVGGDGSSTGMWEYPQAVTPGLLMLLAGFSAGITESRPPNQDIGRSGNPYIDRWFLARKAVVPLRSEPPEYADVAPFMPSEIENLYLHRYHRGDADEPHDHPWPNATLVVRGWYKEAIYDATGRWLYTAKRDAGDIVLRRSTSVHAILEVSEGCLSLFATLPKERDWGYHTADGFVPWREFGGTK